MNNLFLKISCFLTGRNYRILKSCSEASIQTMKKYTAAILIVGIIWAFIGFAFAQRYIRAELWPSIIFAAILVLIVINIERQIILSTSKNWFPRIFRVVIGIVMAVIGSVIVDQMLFREDVERENIANIQEQVNRILPEKTRELRTQINNLDSTIHSKEKEILVLSRDIQKNPTRRIYEVEQRYETDTAGNRVPTDRTVNTRHIPNPNISRIPEIETQIKSLLAQKSEKEKALLAIRETLETELKSKTGFLDEITVLFSILTNSLIALIIWAALFFFFLSIELFVLLNKFGDKEDDYDFIVRHQMDLQKKKIEILTGTPDEKMGLPARENFKQLV